MKKTLLTLMISSCFANFYSQITIGSGTTTGSLPADNNYNFTFSEQIFTKTEINAEGPGQITGVKFQLSPSAAIDKSDLLDVWIGHTTKSSFAVSNDWVPVSNLTNVFSGKVVNNNGSVEITFTAPFDYNNTDNLVIAVNEKQPSYNYSSSKYYNFASSVTNSAIYKTDLLGTAPINPASPGSYSRTSFKSIITLLGLTKSSAVLVPACPTISTPASYSSNISINPDFTWNPSQDATSYKLTVSTTATGSDILNAQPVTGTSYKLSTPLEYNKKYYVKITALNSAGESTGCSYTSFTTKPAPPANDNCSTATLINTFPYKFTQNDGGGATQTDFVKVCKPAGDMNDGVWYTFQGTGDEMTIVVTPVSWNAKLGLYSGTCGQLVCETNVDEAGLGEAETLNIKSEANKTYYLNVGQWSTSTDSPEGNFDISLTVSGTLGVGTANKTKIILVTNSVKDEIQFFNPYEISNVEIFDLSGKKVKSFTKVQERHSVSDLTKGIYLVKMILQSGVVVTEKIIKN